MTNFAKTIDHTILKPQTTESDVIRICAEAVEFGFASVVVASSYVKLAWEHLVGDCHVCTVVGFPLGSELSEVKAAEASLAVERGAYEIDMVIAVGALLSDKEDVVLADIAAVKQACSGRCLKVILETGLLTKAQILLACRLAEEGGADFVKTSTGFGPRGATVEDISTMKEAVGDRLRIKASGGIKTFTTAIAMLDAGAQRLGTSSGPALMAEFKND